MSARDAHYSQAFLALALVEIDRTAQRKRRIDAPGSIPIALATRCHLIVGREVVDVARTARATTAG